MGFLANTLPTILAGNPLSNSNNGPSGSSVNLPDEVKDGDLLIAAFLSTGGPTVAWTTPSGWTLLVAQKNGTNSWGGRLAIFYKVFRTGDSTSVSSSGPSGSTVCLVSIIRSNTDGASLVMGNPPSSGFSGTYDAETTVSGTTFTVPRLQVNSSTRDMRILIVANNEASSPTFTLPTVTPSASNPWAVKMNSVAIPNPSGTFCLSMWQGLQADPSGTEAGTTTWTCGPSPCKSYAMGFAIQDPNATANGYTNSVYTQELYQLDNPILVTGLEHLVVDPRPGGGAVTIF